MSAYAFWKLLLLNQRGTFGCKTYNIMIVALERTTLQHYRSILQVKRVKRAKRANIPFKSVRY